MSQRESHNAHTLLQVHDRKQSYEVDTCAVAHVHGTYCALRPQVWRKVVGAVIGACQAPCVPLSAKKTREQVTGTPGNSGCEMNLG